MDLRMEFFSLLSDYIFQEGPCAMELILCYCLLQNNFHGEELQLYTQYLSQLQKVYAELLVTSNKRMSDLETLQDFLQSATNELIWLNEKEEVEVSRDWSDKNLNIPAIEQYYEVRICHCYSSVD